MVDKSVVHRDTSPWKPSMPGWYPDLLESWRSGSDSRTRAATSRATLRCTRSFAAACQTLNFATQPCKIAIAPSRRPPGQSDPALTSVFRHCATDLFPLRRCFPGHETLGSRKPSTASTAASLDPPEKSTP